MPRQPQLLRRLPLHPALAPTVIVLLAFALRFWWAAPFSPNPSWADPDRYLWSASRLADGSHPWRWTRLAVEYSEFFKAPLYPTVLSVLTARGSDAVSPPRWLLVGQALSGAATVLALYFLGRSLHSRRAGLLAAALYAVWVPNIRLVAVVWQEHLYIPLLVAGFALLARAIERGPRLPAWLVAGAMFGLAALTRSSVAYYVPVAAMVYLLPRPTAGRLRCAAALMTGFLVVTAPYVWYISRAAGHFVLIEDIGTFTIKRTHGVSAADPTITIFRYMKDTSRAPTGLEALRFLSADFAADPAVFLADRADILRLAVKPPGGVLLQEIVAPSRLVARLWKAAVHLGLDLPFVFAAVVWPLGAVMSRRRETGVLLALWIAGFSVMLALNGSAGIRYRSPMEPTMMALGAVVAAGGWRRPRRAEVVAAAAVAIVPAVLVALSLGGTVAPRVMYGVDPWPPSPGQSTTFEGRAAFTVYAPKGVMTVMLSCDSALQPQDRVLVEIEVEGQMVDHLALAPTEVKPVRYFVNRERNVFVEMQASSKASGTPVRMKVAFP